MTSIAMGIFAANMERKLRFLFAPECGGAPDYDFDLGEPVIFPGFSEVPVYKPDFPRKAGTRRHALEYLAA